MAIGGGVHLTFVFVQRRQSQLAFNTFFVKLFLPWYLAGRQELSPHQVSAESQVTQPLSPLEVSVSSGFREALLHVPRYMSMG